MSVEEFTYLRGRTTRPVKVTLLSAQQAAAYYDPEKSRGAYATRDAYLADLVDFTRREIAELGRLGCEYVQIDAPQYAALLDETIREGYRQRGSDPDRLLDACIELDNAIIDGHPGITFGIHICRGNHKSMFYASGGYDRIAEQIFRALAVPSVPARVRRRAVGHVRAAAPRAGRPHRRARAGRARSAPRLESRGELRRRIAEAARSCRSSGWRSARSAASRPRTKATGCRRTISGGSWSSSGGWRRRSGVDPAVPGRRYHHPARMSSQDCQHSQPSLFYPPYQSTIRRAPQQPQIRIPGTFTDLASPLFGDLPIGAVDNDLTRQHAGEPQGERIIVAGRVVDEDGRACRTRLIEIWQATPPAATAMPGTIIRRRSIRISPARAGRSPTPTGATGS